MEDRYGRRRSSSSGEGCQTAISTILVSLVIGFLLFGVGSCIHNATQQPTKQEATSKLLLADVTSAGAGKYSKTTESYWYDPTRAGYVIRCYHDNDWDNLTADPSDCDHFAVPAQLPSTATFAAINMGYNELTQSVWLLPNGKMSICNHDNTFWGNTATSVTGCKPFAHPQWVDPSAVLVSINAGQNIDAQSFWSDGSVCLHTKPNDGSWFAKDGFGVATQCKKLPAFDGSLFPPGLVNPQLEAVTSDSSKPWETFWQDGNGVLVRCKHNGDGGWFSSQSLGTIDHCDYWRAPMNY